VSGTVVGHQNDKIIDVTVQKFRTQIFRAYFSRDEDEEENTGGRE
jgi:hypothetical protein